MNRSDSRCVFVIPLAEDRFVKIYFSAPLRPLRFKIHCATKGKTRHAQVAVDTAAHSLTASGASFSFFTCHWALKMLKCSPRPKDPSQSIAGALGSRSHLLRQVCLTTFTRYNGRHNTLLRTQAQAVASVTPPGGLEDTLEIGRQARHALYLFFDAIPPLVAAQPALGAFPKKQR